jgi:hypothetical protein
MREWRERKQPVSVGFMIEAAIVALLVGFGYLVLGWTLIGWLLSFANLV